jgi:hypothetical protein
MEQRKSLTYFIQKYESKYDGPVPTFDLGSSLPKYESASPTKFEPKFEPKYEPNLSVETRDQQGMPVDRNVLTPESSRAMLAGENNSVSMTLMQ